MKHTTFTLTWAVVGVGMGMALALNEPCRGEENPSASSTVAATKAGQQKSRAGGKPAASGTETATKAGQQKSKAAKKTDKIDPLHEPYDKLLRAYVKNGWVNYKAFKQQEARLDAYLKTLAQTDPAKLTKSERLAYWINAYNAFTIKLILRRYPKIKSIKDIPGRWDRREWTAGGKTYSLGEIEHQILRKRFNEPRIHFALVCASKSCPDLPSEAYTAKRLERQLTAAAKQFLADTKKGFRNPARKGLPVGPQQLCLSVQYFQLVCRRLRETRRLRDCLHQALRIQEAAGFS